MTRRSSRTRTRVHIVDDGRERDRADHLATEEPMEIRLEIGGAKRTVAVTMRTPGSDFELAAGFLYAEGIIASRDDVAAIRYRVDADVDEEQMYNIVTVGLAPGRVPDLRSLERHFFTTSACGVCGKASLEQLHIRGCPVIPAGPTFDAETIYALPARLEDAQRVFEKTGGLHAAGLFTPEGELVAVREDVGRHNAVDKLVGWALLEDRLPLHEHVLMVSGRSSFEIVQKALVAGVPALCAVSAPSRLAVDLAAEFGMTLVGFLRGRRFNVYAGAERIRTGVVAGR